MFGESADFRRQNPRDGSPPGRDHKTFTPKWNLTGGRSDSTVRDSGGPRGSLTSQNLEGSDYAATANRDLGVEGRLSSVRDLGWLERRTTAVSGNDSDRHRTPAQRGPPRRFLPDGPANRRPDSRRWTGNA